MRAIVSAVLSLTVAACMSASQPGTPAVNSPGSIQVSTGQEFDLSVGQQAQVRGTALTVRFISASQDSRCPSDVQCVWAGDALIRLALASGGASASEESIHTNIDPKTVHYSGYQIRVTGLKPVPKSGNPVSAADYVVSLEVVAG